MWVAVTIPTKPCWLTQRSSSSAASLGSIIGSFATSFRRSGAWLAYSARASLSVVHRAAAKSRSPSAHSSPEPGGNSTARSMPSRSMSAIRGSGSYMPGRIGTSKSSGSASGGPASCASGSSARMPPPGRPVYLAFMAATYSRMCDWNFAGMRRRQSRGSPPCPSASIT